MRKNTIKNIAIIGLATWGALAQMTGCVWKGRYDECLSDKAKMVMPTPHTDSLLKASTVVDSAYIDVKGRPVMVLSNRVSAIGQLIRYDSIESNSRLARIDVFSDSIRKALERTTVVKPELQTIIQPVYYETLRKQITDSLNKKADSLQNLFNMAGNYLTLKPKIIKTATGQDSTVLGYAYKTDIKPEFPQKRTKWGGLKSFVLLESLDTNLTFNGQRSLLKQIPDSRRSITLQAAWAYNFGQKRLGLGGGLRGYFKGFTIYAGGYWYPTESRFSPVLTGNIDLREFK